MDVYEIISAVDAEIVANKATTKVDGLFVVVAQVVGDKMVLTAEGEEMAKNIAPAPAPKATATPKSS